MSDNCTTPEEFVEALEDCMVRLHESCEKGSFRSTVSFGTAEIDGREYQIQLRLTSLLGDIIDENSIVIEPIKLKGE